MAPGNAGAWDDGSHGYPDDENYPPADGGGYGYGPGYPGQGQQAHGPQDSHHADPYGQQPYDEYNGYGPAHQGGAGGYASAGGYVGPSGSGQYGRQDDYGHGGQNPSAGYNGPNPSPGWNQSPGWDQAGYGQQPPAGYAAGGGHQNLGAGYSQPPAYPAPPGYRPALPAGGEAYPAPNERAGGYPALPPGGEAYPPPYARSGGYPALPSGQGGQSAAEDAGNGWYGGQPAAANGASFADTGTYRLNGRATDEYGTSAREALRDPGHGYPPEPGQQGAGQPPVPGGQAAPGPQEFSRTGSNPLAETRQQRQLYDDRGGYPEHRQDEPADWPGRGASGGFQGPGGRDEFDPRDSFAAPDMYAGPDHGDYDGTPAPSADRDNDDYENEVSSDPYQERYSDSTGPRAVGGAGQGRKSQGRNGAADGGAALSPLRGKRLLLAAAAVVAVGIIGVAGYVFVLGPSSPASNTNVPGAVPTSSAQPSEDACVKQLGTYCHISAATDDPTPLTTAELFPPAFTNDADKTSYSLVSTKVDKTCSNAVIGSALISALKAGKCTQVVRGSYVSSDNKIMGTIGVVNLSTTNEAHYAGKVVGQEDFITPLTSAKGVASKLGNGTGVVEAEYKGHYLILTWSEFVNGTDPTTKAEDNQLEQFSNDLVTGTANIDLSQRMVTGAAPTPAASASS